MDIWPLLALLAAVWLAIGTIFIRRGIVHAGESFSALVITMFASVLIYLLAVTSVSEWNKIWSLLSCKYSATS